MPEETLRVPAARRGGMKGAGAEEMTAVRDGVSRRRFLLGAGTATGLTILPRQVMGGKGKVAPSDRLNIALIGAGGQGIADMKNLLQEPESILMGVAAVITGEKLFWDGPALRCTNFAPANDLVSPPYREGWRI